MFVYMRQEMANLPHHVVSYFNFVWVRFVQTFVLFPKLSLCLHCCCFFIWIDLFTWEHMSSPSVFIFQFGVHVAQSLVFCGSYFVIFCLFSFGHCIYCLFSFDLPLVITPLVSTNLSFWVLFVCMFSHSLLACPHMFSWLFNTSL